MDAISTWFHNHNIDQTLNRLGTYVDPATSASLLRFLVEEEDRLGTDRKQSGNTDRRVREGRERITRILAIIEGLMEYGLMDQEKLGRGLLLLANMREAQRLVEERLAMQSRRSSLR